MNIHLHSNLDDYRNIDFCVESMIIRLPMVGEFIECKRKHHELLRSKNLPIRLEVQRVTFKEDRVELEVWFSDQDLELIKAQNNGKYLNLLNR